MLVLVLVLVHVIVLVLVLALVLVIVLVLVLVIVLVLVLVLVVLVGKKVIVCAHRYERRGQDFSWGQGLCYTLTQYLRYTKYIYTLYLLHYCMCKKY